MNPGDADVVDLFDLVAHYLASDARFLGDGDVTGARADDCDLAFAANLAVSPDAQGAGAGKVLGVAG